ncbi:hypothetical protein OS242_04450 [Tumebacillus sp. DT12]|uniref:Uncharacterized protein n=1 Tax=Tumebacillus lacus TaxID=2995335 RepID=A0ABT3WYB1_9BACL|nr:hypothetical protein [Tumebacillus lacus]MCX7569201.1 hypothetical protein [Tumebacillus lacus]
MIQDQDRHRIRSPVGLDLVGRQRGSDFFFCEQFRVSAVVVLPVLRETCEKSVGSVRLRTGDQGRRDHPGDRLKLGRCLRVRMARFGIGLMPDLGCLVMEVLPCVDAVERVIPVLERLLVQAVGTAAKFQHLLHAHRKPDERLGDALKGTARCLIKNYMFWKWKETDWQVISNTITPSPPRATNVSVS